MMRPFSSSTIPLLMLARVILSILAFARRPLRVLEIREAFAAFRGRPIDLISDEDIISECPLLTMYVKPRDGGSNGFLLLSHSYSVRSFLHSHAKHQPDEVLCKQDDCSHDIVDPDILADACVNHLHAQHYSVSWKPHSNSVTGIEDPQKQQSFTNYAAKYWYRHCDASSRSERIQSLMKTFLLSNSFYRSIQIQSISVVGHFLINYHPLTGDPVSVKRNLPELTERIDDDEHAFQEQYIVLLCEWSHLLHLGLSSRFVGELDRVLWPTIGSKKFLTGGKCRYMSSTIGPGFIPAGPTSRPEASSCLVAATTFDGKRQVHCYIDTTK